MAVRLVAMLLSKNSCLAAPLGMTKFINGS
jgi:hypothetical protein